MADTDPRRIPAASRVIRRLSFTFPESAAPSPQDYIQIPRSTSPLSIVQYAKATTTPESQRTPRVLYYGEENQQNVDADDEDVRLTPKPAHTNKSYHHEYSSPPQRDPRLGNPLASGHQPNVLEQPTPLRPINRQRVLAHAMLKSRRRLYIDQLCQERKQIRRAFEADAKRKTQEDIMNKFRGLRL